MHTEMLDGNKVHITKLYPSTVLYPSLRTTQDNFQKCDSYAIDTDGLTGSCVGNTVYAQRPPEVPATKPCLKS